MNPIECASRTTVHCQSAGKFMANIMNGKVKNVPYKDVFNFYNRSSCLEPDDDINSVVWRYVSWAESATGREVHLLHSKITEDSGCFFETCENLTFSGNADFAGIGVVIALCVQMSIATCFAILYLYLFSTRSGEDWRPFRVTFHTFFVSSVFINAAIGIAATSTVIMENKSQYTALLAPLGFLLSLASTQTMWAMYRLLINPPEKSDSPASMKTFLESLTKGKVFTETRLLKLCLALLWIALLAICAAILKVEWGSNFELFCFDRLKGQTLATQVLRTPLGLVSFGMVCAVLKKIFSQEKMSKWWEWLGPVTVFLGLVVMWLSFGTLWYLRAQLSTIAGKGYQDNYWGFGQIAAVAALLPTLVDVIHDSHRLWTGEEQREDGEEGNKEGQAQGQEQGVSRDQTRVADSRV